MCKNGSLSGSENWYLKFKFTLFLFIEYDKPNQTHERTGTTMKVGYARVSTKEQSFDLQLDALHKAGCEKIYQDISSGIRAERPALNDLVRHVRAGDILVVWKLDRLGRSLKHLVDFVNELNLKKVGLQSVHDPIDTTTSQGRLVFNLFATLSEFERDLLRERTQAGLSAARARGRKGGRPKGIPKKSQPTAIAAETLYREEKLSVQQIADKLGISKATLYKYLRYRNVPIGPYRASKVA